MKEGRKEGGGRVVKRVEERERGKEGVGGGGRGWEEGMGRRGGTERGSE